jgi:hypothetical protein
MAGAITSTESKTHQSQNTFRFPETGIALQDTALLLSIDDATFTVKRNLCLYLTKPQVRLEPVLGPEPQDSNAPDNLATHFYGTVLHEEGRFRMWYYACHWGGSPDWSPALAHQLEGWDAGLFIGPLCYAESGDGIHWTKPNLGQVLFKGSRDNNALALSHALVSCATVIKDETDPHPARRYKMAYQFFYDKNDPQFAGLTGFTTCAMAVSPDGLHWEVIDTPYPHDFIEHASLYVHNGKYILNSHQHSDQVPGEGGTSCGRQAYARMAYDFDHWLDGYTESFTLPEPIDPTQRGIFTNYDQVHLGVGAASFGTVCVGIFGLWHNADFEKDFERISCDLGFVISNDGLRFREPVKGHRFLTQHDSPATPVPGKNYTTNLCQGNGIINVGDETRIYHGRYRNQEWRGGGAEAGRDYRGEVGLATLPRDRWGALGLFPDQHKGHVWTATLVLPDAEAQLSINADDTSGITIEIADEHFNPISAFSGENRGRCASEGGFDCRVAWPTSSLADLAGQTVRFKFQLHCNESTNPRLYAVSLKVA